MNIKIKSFKKVKRNSYQINFFSNHESIILYDEIILKYNLLIKKELNKNLLKKLILENVSLDCYYKGLNYLNYKRRSKKEIKNYLEKNGFLKEEIELCLIRLEKEGYIDEKKYLKSFINDQIYLNNHGPLKILQKLKLLGFQEKEITDYLETFGNSIWQDKIVSIVNKKIKSNRHLGALKLKEKLMYSLLSEGFKKEDVNNVLDKMSFSSNNTILYKETEKLYANLNRKYEGNILRYKLRIKLLSRGFESDLVNEVIENVLKKNDII